MADGSGEIETLLIGETSRYPSSWSPDGKTLAYTEAHPDTEYDIWLLAVDDGDRVVFRRTPAREHSATFSPDGEWIAYVSDESGQNEVYVHRFPGQGAVHTISTDGGREPLWSRDGQEIYYRKGSQVVAVTIETDEGFSAGETRLLFDGDYWSVPSDNRNYDIAPGSQRFLMVRNEPAPTQLNVVVNWAEELKRLVPAN